MKLFAFLLLRRQNRRYKKRTTQKSYSIRLISWESPLGWSFHWEIDPLNPGSILSAASVIIAKLFGLFISILAVSMGAPFWFDLLSKFVNIRSAGKPPESDRESK